MAEFIGTFALIFVGMLAIATDAVNHDIGRVGIALAHGFTIAVMASAAMAISGGHFNPAVTFGMLVGRHITFPRAFGYWIVQFLGGIFGAYAADFCMPKEMMVNTGFTNASYGLPTVHASMTQMDGHLPYAAILIEVILTFFLMYVILGTAADRRAHKVGALFIGLAVTMDILAGGPLTGAAMNPARWFGPAYLVAHQPGGAAIAYVNWPVYVIGPLLGATLAGIWYGRLPGEGEA
jgi:MIP family channel proteins